MNEITKFLKRNKNGIFFGALLGLGATWYLGSSGANLDFTLQSVGIIDNFVSVGTTSAKLALTKVGTALIIIGATAGALIWEMVK